MLLKSSSVLILLLFSRVHFGVGNDVASEEVPTPQIFNDRSDLTQWINENGGFVDSRQLVRQAYPDDPSSGSGVFATKKIDAGELLLAVPLNILVQGDLFFAIHDVSVECIGEMECKAEYSEDEDVESSSIEESDSIDSKDYDYPDNHDFCLLMNTLTRELELGEDSNFAPYIRYLNMQPIEQIPEFWSESGKVLLSLIGKGIRTMNFEEDHITTTIRFCGYNLNELTLRAAMLITTRSDDDIMTPYYELYNHKNGAALNTWIELNEKGCRVYARKPIEEGEEIFNSYNACNFCTRRYFSFDFGTSEMLNDYGFVEAYPQRWILGNNVRFDLDEKNDGSGELILTWSEKYVQYINKDYLPFLNEHVERLKQIKGNDKLREDHPGITEDEFRICIQYLNALLVALREAIKAIEAL